MQVRSGTQFRKTGASAVMQVRQVLAMSVCFVTAHSCLQFRNSDVIQGCAGGETGDSDIHDILHVKAERSETSVCQKAEVVKKEKWESLQGWLKTNEFQRPGGWKYYILNHLLCEFVWESSCHSLGLVPLPLLHSVFHIHSFSLSVKDMWNDDFLFWYQHMWQFIIYIYSLWRSCLLTQLAHVASGC